MAKILIISILLLTSCSLAEAKAIYTTLFNTEGFSSNAFRYYYSTLDDMLNDRNRLSQFSEEQASPDTVRLVDTGFDGKPTGIYSIPKARVHRKQPMLHTLTC